MDYIAFIHKEPQGCFGVSFPDFPGCISAGDTLKEAVNQASRALAFHVEGLEHDGTAIPSPRSMDDLSSDETLKEWREGAMTAYVPLKTDVNDDRLQQT